MSTAGQSPGFALEMENIGFCYPSRSPTSDTCLYDGFSLRVEQGSILAIMGASGVGKSTLGRIMAGILKPQSGKVAWSPQFRSKSDVAYIDQHPINSVFPWQTARTNIEYPLQKLGWDGARRERVGYLVSLFRLDNVAEAYPAQLSGGELQRVALARCLSWRPALVILDEPFSALDGKVKAEIISALHELATRDSNTLVLITHNVADALALGTRCVVIGKRPVEIISDLEFRSGFPRQEGAPDYEAMEQALIEGIRHGLV
ncbi:MAG TPA: ATP-binding cassette domain-containing protein [Terriglobales bacterium]|jgi:NitT/TauT family transport system ATP-binding protein|nr:ATP-binding cassette domain-containing protein [Terriglobales bacterium]